MKETAPYFLKKLREEFSSRTERRPQYSLRSFAKYLEIEAPSLSGILKGKRKLPKNKIQKVAEKLNLSPQERRLFIESNNAKNKNIQEIPMTDIERKRLNSETHYRIISEWEHYAILSLVETRGFRFEPNWIASRLAISNLRASVCLENLLQAGLIKAEGKKIILGQAGLETTEDISSQALKKARKQDLELAQNAIDEVAVELRDLSASTMTLNIEDLQELKAMIREFRRKFMTRAESKQGNEVYKLAIQLFPLTKLGSENEKK